MTSRPRRPRQRPRGVTDRIGVDVDIFAHRERHDAWLQSQGADTPRVTDALLRAIGPVVYAVQSDDGLIKIGHTTDLARRCKQVGYGHKAIIAFRQGTRADELAIHTHLKGHATQGREWYPWHPAVIGIINEMRADLGITPISSPRAA